MAKKIKITFMKFLVIFTVNKGKKYQGRNINTIIFQNNKH